MNNNLYDEKLFEQYKQVFDQIGKRIGEDDFRTLRLFDIKLRLALGIIIDFDSTISYTRTKITRETYISLVKLTELWNAYESFLQFTGVFFGEKNKYNIIKNNDINNNETKNILSGALETLKKYYNENDGFKRDFDILIKRLRIKAMNRDQDENLKKYNKLIKYLQTGSEKDIITIIELIYVFRNLFYHTGETGQMGAKNLNNRKKVIDLCRKTITNYMLCVSIILIKKIIAF